MALSNYLRDDNYARNDSLVLKAQHDIALRFVFDRTQKDVDYVKELQAKLISGEYTEEEWNGYLQNLKGALNYSDLDRIEANIKLLAEWIGIDLVSMERTTIPRVPYFVNLLTNVKKLRDSVYCPNNAPKVPARPLNTYQKINDIERILWETFKAYIKNTNPNVISYCGEIYASTNNDCIL